jgi:hypothetical protein
MLPAVGPLPGWMLLIVGASSAQRAKKRRTVSTKKAVFNDQLRLTAVGALSGDVALARLGHDDVQILALARQQLQTKEPRGE